MENEKLYTAAILHFTPFGPRTNARLFAHFGSAETIWQAKENQLQLALTDQRGSQLLIKKFLSWRSAANPRQLFSIIHLAGLEVICRNDKRYPTALATIVDPPLGLFLKGSLPAASQPLVSLVGSRNSTSYGLATGHKITTQLIDRGLGVVSGLAQGIDECVHRAAIDRGGYTLAVIAHGHNTFSYRQHCLAQKILQTGGGIVSEYPPTFRGSKHHFPIRNRIIAGWCPGTVIVEASVASGTLITAQSALENSREVFAVPGPINSPTSEGANRLIKDGAHVATCADDIIDALNLSFLPKPFSRPTVLPTGDTAIEQRLIDLLAKGQQSVDELARLAGQQATELMTTLTSLELAGKIRHLGNMEYGL